MKPISSSVAAVLLASSLLLPVAAFAQVTPNGQVPSSGFTPNKSSNDQPGTVAPSTPASVEARQANNEAGQATTAQNFVRLMVESDLFEVQSSRLALTKSHNADIRAFANRMITDHTKSTAALKQTVAAHKIGVKIPTVLVAPQKDSLDKLRSLSGAAFDHAYSDDQLQGHQQALELLQTYAARGDNTALKAFATKVTPTVQDHLDMATKLTEGNIDSQTKPQSTTP